MIYNSIFISTIAISVALVSPIRSEAAPQKYKDIYDWKCEHKSDQATPWTADQPAEKEFKLTEAASKAPKDQIHEDKVEVANSFQNGDETPVEATDETPVQSTDVNPVQTTDETPVEPTEAEPTELTSDTTSSDELPQFGNGGDYSKNSDEALSGAMEITSSSGLAFLLIIFLA